MKFFSKWPYKFFVFCFLGALSLNDSVLSSDDEKDFKGDKSGVFSSSFGDLDSVISDLRNKKVSILLPVVELEENNLFNVLFALKTSSYEDIEMEDLEETNIKILEERLDLGRSMENLKRFIDESHDIVSILKGFQKVSKTFQRKVDPIIAEILEHYKQDSYRRLAANLHDIRENAAKAKEEGHLFVVVFPEAFFNYFKTPRGFGGFMPFIDKQWVEILSKASAACDNVVFVANIIYADEEQDKSKFEENFRQFISGSYNQKGILSEYYRYHGKITPIFNETFIFYGGANLGSYKKQYILDEDVPMVKNHNGDSFLGKQKFLYTPGSHDQSILKGFFTIQICQDHVRIQEEIKSPYFILQSASIDVRGDLKTKFRDGTCIHSDIDSGKSKVYYLRRGVMDVVPSSSFSSFQRYNLY